MEGPFDRVSTSRTLGYFYLAAATLAAVALMLPGHPGADLVGLASLVAVAYAGGAVLVLGAKRLPSAAAPLSFFAGTLVITAAVYFDGHGPSAAALLYVWLGMLAFYFLSRWQGALLLLLMGVAYAGVLTTVPTVQPFQRWLMTVGVAAMGGMLVSYVRDRVRELVDRLTDAARTDPLTGLLNRRAFEERAARELARAQRTGEPFAALVIDVDQFKQINDREGHAAGDAALVALAATLSAALRDIDTVARIGGDEFAVLLPATAATGARATAERLRERSAIAISIGTAVYGIDGLTADELARAADAALYDAKRAVEPQAPAAR
jgi:diguanylate cyclase (GGDEF)-like protein